MPALVTVERLKGAVPGAASAITHVRFRSDDNDERNQAAPVVLPQRVETVLTGNVAASVSPQIVDVVSSAFFAPGDYAICDPGLKTQEVILVSATPDAGVLTAIFRRPHRHGAALVKAHAAYSKTVQARITEKPGESIANLRLSRAKVLPQGVYDQFRAVQAYAEGSGTPWASDASQTFQSVPVAPESAEILAGPWTDLGIMAMIEIQWLFTYAVQEQPPSLTYLLSWDEA